MKRRRYTSLYMMASKKELKKIKENDCLEYFEDWKTRRQKCVISHGDYFEEDKIDIHEKIIFE